MSPEELAHIERLEAKLLFTMTLTIGYDRVQSIGTLPQAAGSLLPWMAAPSRVRS